MHTIKAPKKKKSVANWMQQQTLHKKTTQKEVNQEQSYEEQIPREDEEELKVF